MALLLFNTRWACKDVRCCCVCPLSLCRLTESGFPFGNVELPSGDWRLAFDIKLTKLDVKLAKCKANLRSSSTVQRGHLVQADTDKRTLLPQSFLRARWKHKQQQEASACHLGAKRRTCAVPGMQPASKHVRQSVSKQ